MQFHRKTTFCSARIWIDEQPPAKYNATQHIEFAHSYLAKEPLIYKAAIELLIGYGARMVYGLLGATIIQADQNSISVPSTNEHTEQYNSSICSWTPIQSGLPGEYANSVIAGAIAAFEEDGYFPSGNIKIDCGAHNYQSSQVMFAHTAKIIFRLFSVQEQEITNEELFEVNSTYYTSLLNHVENLRLPQIDIA
jgi:hypothetical protein